LLTDAQRDWKQRAAAFAVEELAGEPEAGFDRDGWQKCAAFGALALTVPAEYGGKGASLEEFVAMMEGLGYATRRLGLLFALNAQVFGAIEPIRTAGTDDQKQRWLPPLACGEWVAAHGVTEPTGGSDISALTTEARPHGPDWVLHGAKHCITCGAVADFHIVYARTPAGAPGCFVVEPGTPGVTLRSLHPAGLHGCGLGQVAFDDVVVPAANVLGRPEAGAVLFQGAIERERACIWGFVLGAMERGLELAVRHANERVVGGQRIASHQAVAHRIAEMKTRLELSRLLVYRATALKAAGRRAPLEAAMTKLYVSESFLQNAVDLVRTYGGSGFTQEAGVEQFVRDALGGVLFSGTNDIQRNIIAAWAGLTPG
jgi:alkylation response protein AidB-like acyl-CoA dehydrogenase